LKKGKPRPKDWLPRKPPAAAPAPPKNVRPSKDAKVDPKKSRTASSRVDYTKDMNSILKGLAKEGGKDEEVEGSPNGVDEGTALIAQMGNEYMTKVYTAIKGQYSVPEIITERERMFLNATVVITINARGQIKDLTFEKRSGNQVFDSAIESAIRRAAPFPPPPEELAGKYASEGIGLDFDARRL
jgi:protein TonB